MILGFSLLSTYIIGRRNCRIYFLEVIKPFMSRMASFGGENGNSSESSEKNKKTFQIDKTAYTVVKEGTAEVLFPNSHDVFYNPVQEFNRDISIAVLREYIKQNTSSEAPKDLPDSADDNSNAVKGVTIVECLAASGLRSIRYAKELSGVQKIITNDLAEEAVESIKRNVKFNNVEHIIEPSHQDAALLLYMNRSFSKCFDIVDLDPYGSPVAFLDAAVQSVKNGGLLMVTCTDLAILCGNHSETCRAKYGAASIKSKCCHEMALRIVLQAVESHANRYGRYIIPLVSISVDFYIRLFMIVKTSQKIVKSSSSKLSLVYQCTGCDVHSFQPLGRISQKGTNIKYSLASGPPVNKSCEHCGSSHLLAGPIWNEEIHDKDFVTKLLTSVEETPDKYNTSRRMIGLLSVIKEEPEESPLYYHVDRLSQLLSVQPLSSKELWSAILNAGYKVSNSHASKSTIKTNAPAQVIWDIMRTWRIKLNEKKSLPKLKPNSVGYKIMAQEIKTKISFDFHADAQPESQKKGVMRYQVNPQANWGPKARARSSLKFNSLEEKRRRLQGKRSMKKDES